MRRVKLTLLLTLFLYILSGCCCIKDNSGSKYRIPKEILQNSDYENSFVYDPNSPYKKVLKKCISINNPEDSCSLEKLPLLMQENFSGVPTKGQIMQRVVVSHKWMGDRFAQMLDILPNDIKKLLGAVTAIVIDDDVIPSYYWPGTGAIYLDARALWLTPEEAQTITKKVDFRIYYGNNLQFYNFWRYVKNGSYAWRYYRLDSGATRTAEEIKYNFAQLLYHELAHANDFTRPEIIKNADKSKPVYKVLENAQNYYISTKLYSIMPLNSEVLKGIGQVLYHGEKADDIQANYTASDIGQLFDEDGADALYAYSNQFEDLAMLFEASMMRYHFGIQRDLAFIPKDSDQYIVAWGKRDRIADEQVKRRALFVVKSLLPDETDWDSYFANDLNSSIQLESGVSWDENLNIQKSKKMLKMLKSKAANSLIPPYL